MHWRLMTIERSLARLELAIASRGSIQEIRRAFDDLLAIYGNTGQLVEVVRNQHEQIQALVDAYTRQSLSLTQHHESSSTERREIKDLLSALDLTLGSFVEVVRDQVHLSTDIARAVGADLTPSEKRAKKKPA